MGLNDMVDDFRNMLLSKGKSIVKQQYVNDNRNFVIEDKDCAYLLKWDANPWWKAGEIVFGVKAWGVAVNYDSLNRFVNFFKYKECKKILFSWTESHGIIYYMDVDEFLKVAKDHRQTSNNERVLVVLIKSLKRL